MDALGNRTGDQTLRDDGTVNFTVDSLTNRYASVGGNSITHDDAGNLTTDRQGYVYFYDYENRVVEIEDSSSNDVAEYAYDALGRRIRMIDSVASTTTLYYYNPEWQVLAEYDGSNNLQRYYIYGNYIDEPLVMHRQSDDEDYYYAHDHLYSTVVLLDDGGSVVERYEYDAYGTTHIMDATYNARSASSYGNPYTFTGRRLDALDGGDLLRMHYRHRDYDTYAGRFLQQDPLGIKPEENWNNPFGVLLQYSDGCDLQGYAKNEPVSNVDPWGLWKYSYLRDTRHRQARTFVEANDVWEWKYNIRGLAQFVRLNEEEFDKWGKRAVHSVYGVKKCGAWVANVAYVDGGDMGLFGSPIPNPFLQTELENIRNHYWRQGYATIMAHNQTKPSINSHLSDPDIIAWGFSGHGYQGSLVLPPDNVAYDARDAVSSIDHKLAQVILFACDAGYRTMNEDRAGYPSWKDLISRYGSISMSATAIRAGSDWDDLPME